MMTTLDTAISAAAGASALAAGGWFYAALHPTSQIFGPVIIAGSDGGELALTYDDGPNPAATPRLLEVLAKNHVCATFFLIGASVRKQPALAREIAAAGHLVGNHTMTHPWLCYRSAGRVRREIADANSAIEDTIGKEVTLFRPPHGARNAAVFTVARELKLATVSWNVNPHDWRPQTAEQISGSVRTAIGRNRAKSQASNILLHDGGLDQPRMPSVLATATIIADAKAARMHFVTPEAWV